MYVTICGNSYITVAECSASKYYTLYVDTVLYFLNIHFQPYIEWRGFVGTSRPQHILQISSYYTSIFCFTDRLNAIIKGLDLMSSRSLEMGTFGIGR